MKVHHALIALIITALAINSQWIQRQSGTSDIIRGVSFANLNTGMILLPPYDVQELPLLGTLLRTTDGGITWAQVNGFPQVSMEEIKFTGPNKAIVLGY